MRAICHFLPEVAAFAVAALQHGSAAAEAPFSIEGEED